MNLRNNLTALACLSLLGGAPLLWAADPAGADVGLLALKRVHRVYGHRCFWITFLHAHYRPLQCFAVGDVGRQ